MSIPELPTANPYGYYAVPSPQSNYSTSSNSSSSSESPVGRVARSAATALRHPTKLARKLQKNIREKERRTEIQDKFNELNALLTRCTDIRDDQLKTKTETLTSAILTIKHLYELNTQANQEIAILEANGITNRIGQTYSQEFYQQGFAD